MRDWSAIAHPGLEPVVARELAQHGIEPLPERGFVRFRAPLDQGAQLAHRLRTPDRILLKMAEGKAKSLDQLVGLLRTADWKQVLRPRQPLTVAVTARTSRLHRRNTISAKVERTLADAVRGAGPARGATVAQRVQVRLVDDLAEVSLCTGGELLHRRGWRSEAGRAPLRENLAASLLLIAGWEGDEALVDPFCGSGTLGIEAALLATGRSPFVGRALACSVWPALGRFSVHLPPPTPLEVPIQGSDREPQALLAAQEQTRRAGVSGLDWLQLDVAEVEPNAPTGVVVANPPYGKRLGNNVGGVYAAFGRTLRDRFTGWRAVFLAPSPALARKVHRDCERITHFSNGGTPVGVYGVAL